MSRKRNPLGTPAKLAIAGLAAAGIYGVTKSVQASEAKKRKAKKDKPASSDTPGVSPLAGVWQENGVVGDQPRIVGDVLLPIELSFKPDFLNPNTGNVNTSSTNVINSAPVLASIVTNLSPDSANIAYEYMLYLVSSKGHDLSKPSDRDKAVQTTLGKVASKVDWTKGLQPYAFGSEEADVWIGVQTLGEIAHQSYWNKQAAGGGGGLVGGNVGDILGTGKAGTVQWRVVLAYVPGDPKSNSAYAGDKAKVYEMQFLDPQWSAAWKSFGAGYYDVPPAVAEAKKLAKTHPWRS